MFQLKVLVVDQNLADRTGGVARMSQEQAIALRTQTRHVTYLNLHDHIVEIDNNVSLEAFRIGTFGIMKPTLRNFRLLKKTLNKNWDLIHVHSPFFLGLTALVYANKNRVPVFFTLHAAVSGLESFALFTNAPQFINNALSLIAQKFLRLIARLSTYVIALNVEIKEELAKIGVHNVKVMRNGRFLNQYANEKVPHKGVELVCVGSVTSRKNQLLLMQSMKFLPSNYHLTIVGEMIEPLYKDMIESYCRKNTTNVTFTGAVVHEKVASYLAAADVCVSASLVEGQSIATLEALSAGLPVVAIKNTSSAELINENNGVVLDKQTTPEQFAHAVLKIVDSVTEGRITTNKIKSTVARFDWQSVAFDTLVMYEETLAKTNISTNSKAIILAWLLNTISYSIAIMVSPFVKLYRKVKLK